MSKKRPPPSNTRNVRSPPTARAGRKGTVRPGQNRTRHRTPSPNTRIDQTALPRLIGPTQPIDKIDEYSTSHFTSKRPPPCRSNFRVLDDGCAGPRHVRLTFNLIPDSDKTCRQTSISLGGLIRPLAFPGPEDNPIPVVQLSTIPRCENCHAYINPLCTFHRNGYDWKCSLCFSLNQVPKDYHCRTDTKGFRYDKEDRPELNFGSVDFVAPPKKTPPKKPAFVFVLDTSAISHSSGFLDAMIDGIFDAVEAQFPKGTKDKTQIAVIAYDKNVKVLTSDGIYIMNDVHHPFLPVPPSKCLHPVSDFEKRKLLLEKVEPVYLPPSAHSKRDPSKVFSCFGAAVSLAMEILQETGGRIVANVVHLPNFGVGALKMRDDRKLYGKKREKELLIAQTSWWRDMAEKCTEDSISFDLFFGGAKYCDILTLSQLSHFSGGSTFHFPNFNDMKDAESCRMNVLKVVTRYYGMDAYAIVRCSPGVLLQDCFGGFRITDYQEIRLAQVHSDTTFVMTFEHEQTLTKNRPFVVQFAMLYTPYDGAPLIRIHTIGRRVSTDNAEIFRNTDLECIMALSAKDTIKAIFNPHSELNISSTLETLTTGVVNILLSYRQLCAKNSGPGQLILPETLKLMPLYCLGFMKNPILNPNVSIDDRVAFMRFLANSTLPTCMTCMYPNLYNVTDIPDNACIFNDNGYFQYPRWSPASFNALNEKEVFLLNTGLRLILCVGSRLPDDIFQSLFMEDEAGVISLQEVGEDEGDNLYLSCLNELIMELRYNSPCHLGVQILRKPDRHSLRGIDEKLFYLHLVDDVPFTFAKEDKSVRKKNPFKMDYTDFLVYCHGKVRKRLPPR